MTSLHILVRASLWSIEPIQVLQVLGLVSATTIKLIILYSTEKINLLLASIYVSHYVKLEHNRITRIHSDHV